MTRFARAKGSKASNERLPEEATPWNIMKQQLMNNINYSKNKEEEKVAYEQRNENYRKFLQEKEETESKRSEWASFPIQRNKSLLLKHMSDKQEVVISKKTNIVPVKNGLKDEKSLGKEHTSKKKMIKKQLESGPDLETNKLKNNKNVNKNHCTITDEGKTKTDNSKLKSKKKKKVQVNDQFKELNQCEPVVTTESKKNKNGHINEEGSIEEKATESVNKVKKGKKRKSEMVEKEVDPLKKKKKLAGKAMKKLELTEEEEKKIEKKRQKKIKQIEKRKQFKQKTNVVNIQTESEINENQNVIKKSNDENIDSVNSKNTSINKKKNNDKKFSLPKNKSNDYDYKRRKPLQPHKMIINGKELEISYIEGFPIKKEDAERIKKLRKELISKGLPRSEIDTALKLERRRAEKALAREKKKVCYNCRKSGHNLSECPELGKEELVETTTSGICFKCGSTEHTHFECKVVRGQEFKFAQCFICQEQGHIARQCPDNARGLYPKGGSCNVCGDVTHLKKDCPQYQDQQKKQENNLTIETLGNRNPEALDEKDNTRNFSAAVQKNKIIKFV